VFPVTVEKRKGHEKKAHLKRASKKAFLATGKMGSYTKGGHLSSSSAGKGQKNQSRQGSASLCGKMGQHKKSRPSAVKRKKSSQEKKSRRQGHGNEGRKVLHKSKNQRVNALERE